ncbi:MAG: hypothetical protein HZB77_16170 [Chloroflexi bacterium]|nr:hypothetical protein [Chloroflexota bacterium]
MPNTLLLDLNGDDAVKTISAALSGHGFYVLRSFDLRSALTAPEVGCECPHHGTEKCDCQFVVLLVYGEAAEPITLTTHSHNNQTRVQIVRDATMNPDPRFVEKVMAVLLEASPSLPISPLINEEATSHA